MNITRRRGAIALFITLGVLMVGLAVTLSIPWIMLNGRRLAYDILGIILFGILIAGVVLNTVFLVREVRRNERQDSFLNAVTHELKTPIASIRLYLETLQRRPVSEEQRQQFYRIMLSDSDRLLATVEQVLRAGESGVRKRRHERTVLDMQPLVAECIELSQQRHHLAPSDIQMAPVPGGVTLQVSGNADDLRTVILNLLDNAVKYSPRGVQVRVSLLITRYTWLQLEIADTGIGLAKADLKRVFKRFYRVPGRNLTKIKGTGLGLFLVNSIMRQHGGRVTAYSDGLGLGTTMRIELPLATPGQLSGESSGVFDQQGLQTARSQTTP
jgi:two-component system sensor histidine kinase SenX3